MKKFGKLKMALMLACASVLNGRTSAVDKNITQSQQTVAAVGGAATFNKELNDKKGLSKNAKILLGIASTVVLGSLTAFTIWAVRNHNKNNINLDNTVNRDNNDDSENDNKDNNYIEEKNKKINIVNEPIVEQKNQIKSAGIQNNPAELANLISELQSINTDYHYELGEKGKVFVSNPVLEMNIENINAEMLREHLRQLCEKVGIKQGIHSGDDDYKNGWLQPAWKYFFVYTADYEYSNTYSMLNDNYKKLLAQCIEFMYQNMNNAEYNEILHMCIEQMSRHGGHCDARAQAITNTVYDMLVNFLRERGKIKSDSLMSDIFCTLKEAMIKEAVETYLKVYAQINDNRNMQHREPLYDVNALTSGLKYLFGMPGGSENDSKHNATKQSFGMQMHAGTFIKLSQMIIYQNDQKSQEIKAEMDKIEISFKEYFEYTEKPKHWLKSILTKIWNYQGQEGPKFREWIKGNRNLKLGEIVGDLPYIFGYNDAEMSELKSTYGLEFLISCVKNGYLRLANDN